MPIDCNALKARVADGYEVFQHFLRPHFGGRYEALPAKKNISSPLREGDSNPSFNIFKTTSGHWMFKDFGTDETGDCIDLVQRMKQLTFPEACASINHEMGYGLPDNTPVIRPPQPAAQEAPGRTGF